MAQASNDSNLDDIIKPTTIGKRKLRIESSSDSSCDEALKPTFFQKKKPELRVNTETYTSEEEFGKAPTTPGTDLIDTSDEEFGKTPTTLARGRPNY